MIREYTLFGVPANITTPEDSGLWQEVLLLSEGGWQQVEKASILALTDGFHHLRVAASFRNNI